MALDLYYHGHACFELSDGVNRVIIDPFLSGNPHAGVLPSDLLAPAGSETDPGSGSTGASHTASTDGATDTPGSGRLVAILVTHAHGDHLGDAIQISKATGAPIVATNEIGLYCRAEGAQAIPAHYGGVLDFVFGRVKLVPAWHSSSLPGDPTRQLGVACGFVIEMAGSTIYHSGDTCLFGDMLLIGETTPVDLALLPIGGHFTMEIEDAVRAVELVAPTVVVPMHYDTFDAIRVDPGEFRDKVHEETAASCVIIPPGSGHTFD